MFFCQVLRNKAKGKTQFVPSCASELILYVPAILLKKYKTV